MKNPGNATRCVTSSGRLPRRLRPLLTLVFLISVCAGFTAFSVTRADTIGALASPDQKGRPTKLSPAAAAQIQALIAEKESRTPAQRKIDSQLIYANKIEKGVAIANGVSRLEVDVKLAGGLTPIEIRTREISKVEGLIKKLGGEIVREFDFAGTVEARMPLDRIEELAADDAVIFVMPPAEAMLNRTEPPATAEGPSGPPSARFNRPSFAERQKLVRAKLTKAMARWKTNHEASTNIGSRNSQGDVTHRANNARGSFGVNGAGIRIGVLSDSFNNLGGAGADVTSGDLPGPGNPNGFTTPVRLAGSGDQPSGGSDEGRAMLQIVHDLAPGAQLFYATAFNSITDFANNIRALRGISSNPGPNGNVTPGCDIILDDIFYFVETGLHDGQSAPSVRNMAVVTQAVNDVTANGALYFSSAGNSGSVTQGTAGAWEGDFVSGTKPAIIPGTGDALAWDGMDVGNTITLGNGAVTMQWSDPIGGSSNDYDLFRLNSSLTTVIASSTNVQTGTQDPFEQVTTGTGTRLVVVRRTGAAARFISLSTNRGRLQYATNGQTRGHSAAATGFGVAATPAAATFGAPTPNGPFPGPFVSTNQVEPFSSDGPRRSFFNADGTAITPGNFLAGTNGGILRQKPDFTAADGVDTTLPAGSGLNPFYGTSAAAPHAGAIAALVKQAAPTATPAQLRDFLVNNALDIMAPGVDAVSGAGILQPFQSVQATGAAPQANLALGTQTVTTGNGRIDPNECNSLNIQLINNGAESATGISATLSTTTANVTITQPTSSYSTIAGGGGTQTNTTPFQVSTTSAATCGTTVSFTLTVTYTGAPSPATFTFSLPLGQDVNSYQFTSTPTGATIPAGGTLVPGTSVDDAVAPIVTPFAFSVYGTSVTAGQTISVSTNGNVQFVASGASDDFVNIGLPAGAAAIPPFPANAPAVFPLWDDLILTTPGGGVFTNTVGNAPNRQFIVEWRGRRIGDGATTQNINFAVVFNEGSNQFQFRYVQTGIVATANGTSGTVGVQSGGAPGSNITQFSLNQGVIPPGLQLAASLGQCTPGSGPCATQGTPVNINGNVVISFSPPTIVAPTCTAQGYANDIVLNGTLTNVGSTPITTPAYFEVSELREANAAAPAVPFRLISSDGATCTTGGLVGAQQSTNLSGQPLPGTLAPGASVSVTFRIAVPSIRRFRFLFNVVGVVSSSSSNLVKTFGLTRAKPKTFEFEPPLKQLGTPRTDWGIATPARR